MKVVQFMLNTVFYMPEALELCQKRDDKLIVFYKRSAPISARPRLNNEFLFLKVHLKIAPSKQSDWALLIFNITRFKIVTSKALQSLNISQ